MILLSAGEGDGLFNLDWTLISGSVMMIIAIFVLYLAMSYFLFNPARKLLSDRREKIKGELDDAKTNMEEAVKLREEYEAKLKNINKEADEILSEARKKGLANENQIVAQAKEEAARILERARTEAKLEKQKMSDDIKKEIVSVASVMAGKVIATSIDEATQNRLIEETLKEMGEETWLS